MKISSSQKRTTRKTTPKLIRIPKKQKPKMKLIKRLTKAQNVPQSNKKTVIIDGENVSYNEVRRNYDGTRIQRCDEWFQNYGCQVLVAMPNNLLKTIQNISVLNPIQNEGRMLGHECPNNNPWNNTAMEGFILQHALENDCAVISERTFADMHSNNPQFRALIEGGVIGFMFFKDRIFIPSDPYGRYGPLLVNILNK